MKSLFRYLLSRKYILIICLMFIIVRLIFLDQLFLSRDERDLSLTGYSIARTGKDLFGNKTPLSFERISPNAPVVAVYYDTFWWLMPIEKNVFNARLAFLLPASFLPLLVYELILSMTKKKNLSFLTAIIFSFSPWVFHVSRLALEINLALPLLLLALVFQLYKKNWLSILFYSLTFFTYQGFRPLIIALPIYLEAHKLFLRESDLKKSTNFILRFFIIFVLAVFISNFIETGMRSRSMNEIIFFNSDKLAKEVTFMRAVSSAPKLMKSIVDNKMTRAVDYMTTNLMKGLDLSFLFKSGDYDQKYSNGVAGQFFLVLCPFLFLGLFFIRKKPVAYYFAAGLALVGLLPAIINTYSLTFSIRAIVASIGLSFIMALGMMECYSWLEKNNKKNLRIIFLSVFALFFILEFYSFFHHYFFTRFGLYSEVFSEADRKIANYLDVTNGKYKVASPLPYQVLMNYVFLTRVSKQDLSNLSKTIKNRYDDFSFKGHTFLSCEKTNSTRPEDIKMSIMSELCISGEKKPLLEKLKIKTVPYSSYAPFKYETKPAYYIFGNDL